MIKKKLSAFLAAVLLCATFAGCAQGGNTGSQAASAGSAGTGELKVIRIGASPTPHGEILKEAAKVMKEKGYDLQITEFSDYVIPNTALEEGELDANYFQHKTYLDNFNVEKGTHLVSVGAIHYEPYGIYAGKTTSLSDLPDGATVAVPNDVTNEARALLLLQAQGLLKLKDGAGITATQRDIVENPKNLKFMEIEAAQLVPSLPDVDIAVINGNYAILGGLKVADALAVEANDSESATAYANVVAVKEGHENDEGIKILVEVLKSDDMKKFINDSFDGAVVPVD